MIITKDATESQMCNSTCNCLLNVTTTKGASIEYGIGDSTVRAWIRDKLLIENVDYIKSGSTIIALKSSIERIMQEKNLLKGGRKIDKKQQGK